MLDSKWIREHIDDVRAFLSDRRYDFPLDSLISLESRRREILNEVEELKAKRPTENQAPTLHDLYEAIMEGAVERVRPKMMTVVAIMAGLLPILWRTGTGSEVMSRTAAPMVGGMVSSTILTLVVIPAIYALVKQWGIGRANMA